MNNKLQLTFKPDNISVNILPGTTILKAAGMAGIQLNSPCGGNGICQKCRVKILTGEVDDGWIEDGYYMSCKAKVLSNTTVEIPEKSRQRENRILERGEQRSIEVQPNIRKTYLEIPEPSITDQIADFERIRQALEKKVSLQTYAHGELLPLVPVILRQNDYKITVVTDRREIITIEPGDSTKLNFGIAFDVGTTTVAGLLVDLNSGEILASGSRTNPQAKHGDDVVSRIDYSATENGLTELSNEIKQCLNDIITELTRKTNIQASNIYEIAIAGNTTMNHLLLGVPCGNIAQAPYIPAYRGCANIKANKIGLKIHPQGNVFTLPNIAGFVGADISAAILASGIHENEKLQLLIDIGTNGEIALGNKNKLVVCSTAAGPAFEGARLSHGMRGARGAIEKVTLNEDIHFDVIGNQPPQGICGSGVIDLLAELLKHRIVDETGRFQAPGELPVSLPKKITNRIQSKENGRRIVLFEEEGKPPVSFTQRDVREVQLAKAAIYAGIQVLLKTLSINASELDAILLAGAFGNHIRAEQAKEIGLLPNISSKQIRFIGNAAIEGALRVLLSQNERNKIETLAGQIEYIELSARPDFQEFYMMAMMFDVAS